MANSGNINEIEELFKLLKEGVISKEEFELLKAKAIGSRIENISTKHSHAKEDLFIQEEQEEPESQKKNIAPETIQEATTDGKNKNILISIISIAIITAGVLFVLLNDNSSDAADSITEQNTNWLTIEGENIWVRSTPSTGEVIMKLNNGDMCEVLEKGKFEEIRNMYDYWYKIKYNGQIGWVYGSQSNLKTGYTYADAVNKKLIKPSESAQNSPKSIQAFFSEYTSTNNNLNRFVHSTAGLYILNNPGSMCYGSKSSSISIKQFGIQPKNVFNGIPEGDHCGGYENSSDGFYYETINRDDLPIFTTDGENISKLPIPYNYEGNNIVKVCIVKNNSWLADFYFIKINGEYFIICQDFCDCSA